MAIDPFDPLAHSGLGRLALKSNQPDTAVREFKAALALGPADKASAHCDLAEAYLLANRPAEAKVEALAALEIAPSFDRAQELLLRSIKGRGVTPEAANEAAAPRSGCRRLAAVGGRRVADAAQILENTRAPDARFAGLASDVRADSLTA